MISAAATPSAGSACQAKPQSEAVEGVAPFFCYPGIARFSTDFGYRDYLQAVAGLRTRGSRNALALSLYLPAPSSAQPCILDGESVEGEVQDGSDNLAYLLRECEMQGRLFTGINQIAQMTLAGAGVATLAPAQLIALMQHLRCWFQFAPGSTGVYAIDVDVRRVTDTVLNVIRGVGFNQIRLRYPPIDPADTGPLEGGRVQHQTLAGMRRVKSAGYRSIQIDLQGGLARLDRASLVRSLDAMINAQIDRIVVAEDSPADTDVALLRARCIWQLERAGYSNLGSGYFVHPNDPFAVAQQQGRLHVSLDGFSAQAHHDVVACGMSAVSAIGSVYSQNVATLDAYCDEIDDNTLPIARGYVLGMDDALRRTVMQMLMSNLSLSVAAIEQAWLINFATWFAPELLVLQSLADQGLLCIERNWISVNPRGRLAMRSICAVFDRAQTPAV